MKFIENADVRAFCDYYFFRKECVWADPRREHHTQVKKKKIKDGVSQVAS